MVFDINVFGFTITLRVSVVDNDGLIITIIITDLPLSVTTLSHSEMSETNHSHELQLSILQTQSLSLEIYKFSSYCSKKIKPNVSLRLFRSLLLIGVRIPNEMQMTSFVTQSTVLLKYLRILFTALQ